MRHLACLLIVLGLPMVLGCTSLDVIIVELDIPPDGKEYGPFSEPRAVIWEAAREVIADEGYRFPESEKEKGGDWEFTTDYTSYGSDWRYENHRYRITVTLSGPEGATVMEILAWKQSNSGNNAMDAKEDAWESQGNDEELTDQYAWSIRKKFSNDGDIYEKLMRRYEEEGRTKPTDPDYSNPDGGSR